MFRLSIIIAYLNWLCKETETLYCGTQFRYIHIKTINLILGWVYHPCMWLMTDAARWRTGATTTINYSRDAKWCAIWNNCAVVCKEIHRIKPDLFAHIYRVVSLVIVWYPNHKQPQQNRFFSLEVYIYIYIYMKWTVFVNVTTKSAQHAIARNIAINVEKMIRPLVMEAANFTKWLPPWRKGRITCLWIKSVFDCLTIGITMKPWSYKWLEFGHFSTIIYIYMWGWGGVWWGWGGGGVLPV